MHGWRNGQGRAAARMASMWLALLLLAGCQTPMSPSFLPGPRMAAVSSPGFAYTAPGTPPATVYLQDGQLLKAYRVADGQLRWAQPVGYFWAARPIAGADGTVFVLTYDLLPSKIAANFVLHAFNADGTPRAHYNFIHKPTPPLALPDGSIAVGLSLLTGSQPELKATGQEPEGATLVGLTPDLLGAWNNNLNAGLDITLPLVADGVELYAADGRGVSVVGYDGTPVGRVDLLDPQGTEQVAAAAGACYVVQPTGRFKLNGAVQAWVVNQPLAVEPATLCADAAGMYFVTTDNAFRAYAAADGAERWVQQFAPGNKVFPTAAGDNHTLFLLDRDGGVGGTDLLLAYSSDGLLLWSSQVPAQALGALIAAPGYVGWAASPQRINLPQAVEVYSAQGDRVTALPATETLPQAVVNGQSTLNPPWPALVR